MADNQDFELRQNGPRVARTEDAKEEARTALRQADAGYRAVVALADEMLNGVEQHRVVDKGALGNLVEEVLMLHFDTEASLLFENLQLIRFDNRYYQYHAVNVALLNCIIGEAMDFAGDDLKTLITVGLVIDLGMLALPASIRNGVGQLGESERARIRAHTRGTLDILQRSGVEEPAVLNAVLYHHERFNGQGYPDGLSGEAIPLEARITAASDSYDAASARKSYRKSKSPFEVLAELAANADNALDPAIAKTAALTLAEMLVGRRVILSDHSVGKVVDIRPENLAYPQVIVVGRRIQTGPELYPVSLSSFVPLF